MQFVVIPSVTDASRKRKPLSQRFDKAQALVLFLAQINVAVRKSNRAQPLYRTIRSTFRTCAYVNQMIPLRQLSHAVHTALCRNIPQYILFREKGFFSLQGNPVTHITDGPIQKNQYSFHFLFPFMLKPRAKSRTALRTLHSANRHSSRL